MAIKWICGGHRFFSKSQDINNLWKEIMPLQGAPSKDDIELNNLIEIIKKQNFSDTLDVVMWLEA